MAVCLKTIKAKHAVTLILNMERKSARSLTEHCRVFCPESIGYSTIMCKDVGGLCLGELSPTYLIKFLN